MMIKNLEKVASLADGVRADMAMLVNKQTKKERKEEKGKRKERERKEKGKRKKERKKEKERKNGIEQKI